MRSSSTLHIKARWLFALFHGLLWLNKFKIKDSYLLLLYKDLLDYMGSSKYFTSINLCSRYWKCYIAYEDIPKSTFLMKYGLYKWVVMLIELMNSPSIFIWTINNLFFNMLDSSLAVFLDDILVYLCMVKEHFMLPKKILVCLYQYTFYCKLKKCSFLCNSTTFLGFNIIPKGMYISD